MTAPEFSRKVRVETMGAVPREISIEASAGEREALARRFGLVAIEALSADLNILRNGEIVRASGVLHAKVTQSCVASGAPVEARLEEPFEIAFAPPPDAQTEEEIELSASDCDTIFYSGPEIDAGEAVAETLSLSLDPWPRAPDADEALRVAGVKSEAEAGPFAALAGLKDQMKK